jgi:hypothetical protein
MALHLERSASEADTSESATIEAGARGAGDYRCLDCGYGIVTFSLIPTCPMCHGALWESARWSPFTARDRVPGDAPHAESLAED